MKVKRPRKGSAMETCFCFSCEAAEYLRQVERQMMAEREAKREEERRQQQARDAFTERHGETALRNLGRL